MQFNKIITLSDFMEIGTYQYTFDITEKGIELHSISRFKKRSSSGKMYDRESIYHHEHKQGVYNYETHEWDKPVVPLHILEQCECYRIGLAVKSLSITI
jgi:hypothetical protein